MQPWRTETEDSSPLVDSMEYIHQQFRKRWHIRLLIGTQE